jgi:hypothetical protein
MIRLRRVQRCSQWLRITTLGSLVTIGLPAAADRGDASGTVSGAADRRTPGQSGTQTEGETKSRWHGSVLLFDQSVTTTTIGLGQDYQSYNPTYELWFALKPRYSLYEDDRTSISLNLWANLYLELTNSDTTTTEHEPLLGPTFLSASFAHTLFERDGAKTSFNIGPRVTLPTDKESRNIGRYLALGAIGGVSQTIPLLGKDASALNSIRFGVSSIYAHPFNRATTPTSRSDVVLAQPRQDVAGRLLQGEQNDQLRGTMNVKDSLSVAFSAGAQITPKLEFGMLYVIGNSWTYWPSPALVSTPLTGPIEPQGIDNPTNHRVSTWALASLDYEVMDEFSLGLGYYNQTNQIGPDGQRRSPLWSPEARAFLTVTFNLDTIVGDLAVKPAGGAAPPQTASQR